MTSTTPATTRRVVIIEGPDGSGKTTLAWALTAQLGAMYVHHGVYPGLGLTEGPALARFYAEAMLPALLGLKPVVLDRAWPSEAVYGPVCRGGARLDAVTVRQLERLALRGGAHVVLCLPPKAAVLMAAQATAQYPAVDQLPSLYAAYQGLVRLTALPVVRYDYTRAPTAADLPLAQTVHPLHVRSAGSWGARVVLVGETFAHHTAVDMWYQWPFGGLGKAGCSRWITEQLEAAEISEVQLLWVNADQDLTWLSRYLVIYGATAIALGLTAATSLAALEIPHRVTSHPQHHKRFHSSQPYRLIELIKELLC